MKSEPLDLDIKNEALEIITGRRQYNLTLSDIDTIEIVLNLIKQRIKSAVQGLVEELKEKQAHARVYQSDESLEFYEGYEEGIFDAIELIKKWFADVISGEEK